MSPLTPRQRKAQLLGFIGWAGLLVLQPVWHAWLAPPQRMSMAAVLVLSMLPLLLPMLALRTPRRALLLAGMLALFYFSHGIAEAWSVSDQRWPALAEIAFSLLLIGALGAGVQRRGKARQA